MRIIVDTNIWYYMGQDAELDEMVKDLPIVPTIVSLSEVGTTLNLKGDSRIIVRDAIIKMMRHSNRLVLTPPFHQLASLVNEGIVNPDQAPLLNFTKRIANGLKLEGELRKQFFHAQELARKPFDGIAEIITDNAQKVFKHKKSKHWVMTNDTLDQSWNFICYLVEMVVNCKLAGANLNDVELFARTFDSFTRHLQLTGRKMRANDFSDLMNMVYVSPVDKYLTADEFILKKAKDAGVGSFLVDDKKIIDRIEWIKRKNRG